MLKTGERPDRGAFGLGLGNFFFYTIFGVISPYLQILLRGLGHSPAEVGFLLGVFELVGMAAPLLMARLADRLGRVRLILAAAALFILASLPILVRFPTMAGSVAALVLLSIGLKSFTPLLDAASTNYVEASLERGGSRVDYGMLRAAGSAGFIVVALALQAIPGFAGGPPSHIALATGVATLIFLPLIPFIPEQRRAGERNRPSIRTGRRFAPGFALGLVIIGLGRFAMAPIGSFFSLYVQEELHWNAVGGLWALAAAVEIPLMLLATKIVGKIGAMRAIAISTAAVILRLGICAFFPSPAGAISAQLLHSLCFGLFQPAAVVFVTLAAPPERRASAMALYIGFGVGLPTFLGSALGGLVVEKFGYRGLFASFIVFALASLGLWALNRDRFEPDRRIAQS